MSVQPSSSHKITPFLWFDNNVEEAVNFYISIFPNSKIITLRHKGDKVQAVTFELDGLRLVGFNPLPARVNGGTYFKFNEAISLFIACETQEEIDEKWEKLLAGGGKESQCGWLKDRFGLSWQVAPPVLVDMLHDKDEKKAQRVMDVMLPMKKLDLAALKKAFEEE